MTWDGWNHWCDNCRRRLSGTKYDLIFDSVTYAPGTEYHLCEGCSKEEEEEEERLGTNDMPHRANRYAKNAARGYDNHD